MSEHEYKPEQINLRQAIISLLTSEKQLAVILDKTLDSKSKIAESARQIRWALKKSGLWQANELFHFICDHCLFEVDATDNDVWPTVRAVKVPKINGRTLAMPFDEDEGEG